MKVTEKEGIARTAGQEGEFGEFVVSLRVTVWMVKNDTRIVKGRGQTHKTHPVPVIG